MNVVLEGNKRIIYRRGSGQPHVVGIMVALNKSPSISVTSARVLLLDGS